MSRTIKMLNEMKAISMWLCFVFDVTSIAAVIGLLGVFIYRLVTTTNWSNSGDVIDSLIGGVIVVITYLLVVIIMWPTLNADIVKKWELSEVSKVCKEVREHYSDDKQGAPIWDGCEVITFDKEEEGSEDE